MYTFRLYKNLPMVRDDSDYIPVNWGITDAYAFLRLHSHCEEFSFESLAFEITKGMSDEINAR